MPSEVVFTVPFGALGVLRLSTCLFDGLESGSEWSLMVQDHRVHLGSLHISSQCTSKSKHTRLLSFLRAPLAPSYLCCFVQIIPSAWKLLSTSLLVQNIPCSGKPPETLRQHGFSVSVGASPHVVKVYLSLHWAVTLLPPPPGPWPSLNPPYYPKLID